ncbi:hypothetical protein AB4389_21820 [Vibrio cyclitrophicus]
MTQNCQLQFVDPILADELTKLNIDGLKVGRKLETRDCADPEVMAASNQVFTFVVTTIGPIALNLFSAWLYDKLKSKPSSEVIKVNGIEISGNVSNLKVEINNYINNQQGVDK